MQRPVIYEFVHLGSIEIDQYLPFMLIGGGRGDIIGGSFAGGPYGDEPRMGLEWYSSCSSSGEESSSNLCGDPTLSPSAVSFSCSILMTAGLPPRKPAST